MISSESNKELDALIDLIDEPDETIYLKIRARIISYGKDVLPFLENALENNLKPLPQKRIEQLLHKLRFDTILNELSDWYLLGGSNLLLGYLIITKYQYPHLDEVIIKDELEKIRKDVWFELNSELTALEKVKLINHVLFDVHNFVGDRTNFHSPLNSYLNTVMESHKGNPLSISMIYIIISDLLEIPIYGVNLPEHFILAYLDRHNKAKGIETEKPKVLFYINPFSGGTVFSKNDIDEFLRQIKIDPLEYYYQPCSNVHIIRRLLRNLIFSYETSGNKIKASELEKLMEILK
ncbi:MAG: transglutaminase-like domain-containing protein [Bacteroidota bacterium]